MVAVKLYSSIIEDGILIPMVSGSISAGFPSPADDFMEQGIDLNKQYVKRPSATFYARVSGSSMIGAGIYDGDLLIVDKSIIPSDNSIAVCFIDGDFTIKRIKKDRDCVWLVPENDNYKPIKVTEDNNCEVWGTVLHSIKSH